MVLAASVALLAGLVGGILATLTVRGPAEPADQPVALVDMAGVSDALGSLATGGHEAAGDGEIVIIASFETGDGDFCGEFEFGTMGDDIVVSVVCRTEDGW
ncbi:hypothetical protein C8N42_104241 [Celeribacter persicus]|uniref:Uncharacterized protein n=1 Tax=Celeribacter persicus TaxID=1651082 RepID=A0A2T5HSS4_9RHOB|nr:hypothetical protein C8N42_104241 [Celeribacter persicus]